MHTIYLDIETIPQQPEDEAKAGMIVSPPAQMSKPETIEAWFTGKGKYAGAREAALEEMYRKTALDGTFGEVISIALDDGNEPWQRHRNLGEPEGELLEEFALKVRGVSKGRSVQFVGHNIPFDLKFLHHRLIIRAINAGFALPFDGKHGQHYYCTMQAWAGFRQYVSQDTLCKVLGIEGKPDDIDGSVVWDFVKSGKVDRVAEYNELDVQCVKQIYRRLTFRSAA